MVKGGDFRFISNYLVLGMNKRLRRYEPFRDHPHII